MVNDKSIKRYPQAEFLLFAADRAQHFHEIIIPAYKNGTIIISDRCADSSLVYQGYAQGVELAHLHAINKWVMQGIHPSITLYLKVSLQTALNRLEQRNNTITQFENKQLLTKVVNGFDELYHNRPDVCIIDAEQSLPAVINAGILALGNVLAQQQHHSCNAEPS